MTEIFMIRFQLVKITNQIKVLDGGGIEPYNDVKALDSFLINVPEHVWGVRSSKSEAPYLVAQAFFERMKKRLGK